MVECISATETLIARETCSGDRVVVQQWHLKRHSSWQKYVVNLLE